MQIERYQSGRSQGMSGCSCGIITLGLITIVAVVVILIAPALPIMGLQLAGFQPIDDIVVDSKIESAPAIYSTQNLSQVILSAGARGQQNVRQSSAYTMQIGTDDQGSEIAQITISEAGILALCNSYADSCSASGTPFRNGEVNLQNNHAIMSGEAFIQSLNTWQPIAVIVSLTSTNSIDIKGIEVNGELFLIPENELGQRIHDIQSVANEILFNLTMQSNGKTYRLSDITISETHLVATFR